MYDANPNEKGFWNENSSSFQCFYEPVKLLGNFYVAVGQQLHMYFEKCDSKARKTCKTD